MTDTAFGLSGHGFRNLKAVNFNLSAPALYEEAVRRGEGHVAANGPLVVKTGIHTGRSAGDKFTVRDATTESQIWWDNNKAMSPAHFDALYADMMTHAKAGSCSPRTCSAAPTSPTAFRCAWSPNMPGTRCSCTIC